MNMMDLTIKEVFWAFIIVFTVIFSLYEVFRKTKGILSELHDAKRQDEAFKAQVKQHTDDIKQINEKVDQVVMISNQSVEINKIQTRHSIVTSCIEVLEKGRVEQYQLQSIEDMYTMYSEILHGNSYVTTLVNKVRALPIICND